LPLTADGSFFLPVWSSFRVDGEPGVLEWYTVLVGLHAVLALALHGAFWLVSRADGEVHARAQKLVQRLLVGAVVTGVSATSATFWVHPETMARLVATVPGIGLVVIAGASLAFAAWCHRRGRSHIAFWVYAGHLVWTILGAAYAIYPHGLPALRDSSGITLEILE
jgi:cytochrome d ubiquinol oxidase subunit II